MTYIEAVIKGMNERSQAVVDSTPDVPEKYRTEHSVPSWAGTFGLRRKMFTLLHRLGRVSMMVMHAENGVYTYKVKAPLFKSWQFSMTPELLFLAVNIADGITSGYNQPVDILFNFRERKMFLPAEGVERFINSIYLVARFYGARINSFQESMLPPQVVAEDKSEGDEAGKDKRVLH